MRNPDLAFRSLTDQYAHGERELITLVEYLQRHSPYYRRRFDESGIDIRRVTTLEHLTQLPTTTKEDIQLHNNDFCCVPRSQVREYMSTSGTLGKPVSISLTERDLKRLAYNEAQSFRTAGAQPGELYQLALTLDRQFMAGAAYYAGLRSLGAATVRTGPGLPAMQWETIQRLQPDALVAVPSFILKMLDWAVEAGLNPNNSSIKKIVCIGESLRQSDLTENALAKAIKVRWNVELYGTYAATEIQTAFTECSAGAGGHVQPDLCIVEILDAAGNALPDGQAGEVTVTTLGIEGMPLLRFRTGDIAAKFSGPCTCGRHSPRLGPVIGRRQQMIKYKGTTLYPPAIFDLLNSLEFISGYFIEAVTDMMGQDDLRILVSSSMPEDACMTQLKPLLQHKLRVAPAVFFKSEAEILGLQQPAGSRKVSRFADRRKEA